MTALNDWNLKKLLILCVTIAAIQSCLVLLAQYSIDIPVIRQINGFLFVTLVPGILILRILRVHNINIVESIAYTVGLSLTTVMFSAAAINFILPLIKLGNPITPYPILITLVAETIILGIAAWTRDRNFECTSKIPSIRLPSLNVILILLIILLMVILGVKIHDLTGNSWGLIASLLIIALVVALATYKRVITPGLYPAVIFIISLGLLYQTSLMTPYLVGTDIYTEYRYYSYTINGGTWDHTLPNAVNSCLSIIMLAPSYSFMMGIDGVWVFKAVYPILFSIVPLIMFRFIRIQIGALPAFLAVFFFMAVPTFSLEMISLCRQQVAEIFFSLFVLLLVDRKINNLPKTIMMVLFTLSIVVSHYSLSFIALIYMALFIPLVLLIRSGFFLKTWGYITSRTGGLPEQYRTPKAGTLPVTGLIIAAILFWVLGITWYILIAGGINFNLLSSLWTSQSTSAVGATATTDDLLIRAALGMDFFDATWQGMIFRILQYITQLFIIAGCLRLLLAPKSFKFRIEYIAISVLSVAMLAACVRLPNFASAFNTTRWYHVLLITLAPFFITSGATLLQLIRYAWDKIRKCTDCKLKESPSYLKIITFAVIIPYFITTSGILYEVTGMKNTVRIEAPFSIALSSHRLNLMGNFSSHDDYAAHWLASTSTTSSNAYSDIHTWKILLQNEFPGPILTLTTATEPNDGDVLFLTDWNVSYNELTFASGYPGLRAHTDLSGFVNGDGNNPWKERIYNNGTTQIMKVPQGVH